MDASLPSPSETVSARQAKPSFAIGGTAPSGWVAQFTWAVDRWCHRVLAGPPAAAGRPAWESVEGPWPVGGDPRWPASPVIVELSRVARPGQGAAGGAALVGVGLAGRSHFSASITADPHHADAIRFEMACRVVEPPHRLGSTYRVGGHVVRIDADGGGGGLPRTVVWAYSIGPEGLAGVVGAKVSTSPG